MSDLSIQKNNLRKIYKKKRSDLEKEQVQKRSDLICANFIKNLLPRLLKTKPEGVFSIYLDSYNEVCTKKLAEYFIEHNINFCYPKITTKNSALKFISYQKNQDFAKNKFFKNIIEPENGKEVLPDFVIIPLVAFDKKCNRLGMGGGFFDRTLSHFTTIKHKIVAIGLAYEFQQFDAILPHEKTDQSLDFIVLEDVITF